ncbi:MAG: putative bifunctional diguanylate cyclase/phosphodiesterase [Vulcanimicrobiaceae bacterium]
MKREPASMPQWRDSLGIIVTVLSAMMLAFVLFQVSRLDRQAGVDRATLARERLSVATGETLVTTQRRVIALQESIVLSGRSPATRLQQSRIDRELQTISRSVATGPLSELGVRKSWAKVSQAWSAARRAPEGVPSLEPFHQVAVRLQEFLFALEDASNLTYDSSQSAQNLADIAFNETPPAFQQARRVQLLATLAKKTGTLPLKERLILANITSNIGALYDLSGDHVAAITARLSRLAPQRAADFAALPGQVAAYERAGAALHTFLLRNVLLSSTGSIPIAALNARVDAATSQATALSRTAFAELRLDLDVRDRIEVVRNRYWYMAFLVAAITLIGLMLTIAQFVIRRDRAALRQAQNESARLSAELARSEAEEALRFSEAQFRAVFDGAALGIAVVDRSGVLVDSNSVFQSMFGGDIGIALRGHEEDLADLFSGRRDTFEFEQHLRPAVGDDVWTDATVSIVTGNDETPVLAVCMFRDKTALKHSERRILHDKTHDALTGLPNRQLFEEHLRHRFDEANALLDSFFAVLFVDIEHFKDVNESLGHATGDVVLGQIAQRMRTSIDVRDVVARIGSDEFAVLIQSLGDILHVESVARRILNNLSKSITVGSRSIYLGASVGIAIGSSSYERAEDVMRDAEVAMQHAKIGGGARYAVFDSKMQDRAQKRLGLASDIRLALERNEFRLLYQPIVTIADGKLVGCEALLRWDHPVEGVLNPMEFMPLAEQSGLATPVGRFVLQTAAEQFGAWRRNRNGSMDFTMHVNVSASELMDPDFERALVQCVEHNGLSPADLTIEITESVVLDSGTRANLTLEHIRDRGFSICIDDFGTGYSSLRYLQQFKVDAIKIDRGFVAGSDGELASEPIVRTFMTLAEAFDVRVVAEGVETTRQRDILRNAGCRFAQGYLFSRPLSAADLVAMYPDVLGNISRSASA